MNSTENYITQLLSEIIEGGCTIPEENLRASLGTLVTLAKGEQRLEENRVYMDSLNNSKEIIGHFLTEPEDVKPDFIQPIDMVKGEWYVIKPFKSENTSTYLTKHNYTNDVLDMFSFEYYNYEGDYVKGDYVPYYNGTIRPATREEVLKYFPNEFQ